MTIAIVENNTLVVTVGSYATSITAASITSSFDALSHFPERRAAGELSDLAIRINTFGDYVDELAAREDVAAASMPWTKSRCSPFSMWRSPAHSGRRRAVA